MGFGRAQSNGGENSSAPPRATGPGAGRGTRGRGALEPAGQRGLRRQSPVTTASARAPGEGTRTAGSGPIRRRIR